MKAQLARAVIDAVANDGFVSQLTGSGLTLSGSVLAGKLRVPIKLVFNDLEFIEAPRAIVDDPSLLPRPVVPHLDDAGELCVINRSFHVFDRYSAAAQTRGIIMRAAELLTAGLSTKATAEIAREFPSYWSGVRHDIDPIGPWTDADQTVKRQIKKTRHEILWVKTDSMLSFDADQSKPTSLGALLDWAARWDRALANAILDALSAGNALDPSVAIEAANGIAIARVRVSDRGAAFVRSLERPSAWQRWVRGAEARKLAISRVQGRRTDLASVLGASGAAFAGRAIILIGCGAIGGYLARMLAQLGAGLSGGRLTLIDADTLDPFNIRRHALGAPAVGSAKAEAVAAAILRDFPGLDVFGRVAEAQTQGFMLKKADLVIDATGEQGLAEWLNDWHLHRNHPEAPRPTMLHCWVEGAGAAVQSFISTEAGYACYRCLQPNPNERARFYALRDEPAEPVAACGEQLFTPYGPAAPIAAASLAAQHATDWARGNPHKLLRTLRLDWDASVRRDPTSPPIAPNCPACGVH